MENRRRPAFGVTARLIALVMIPVTVMCGLAVSEVLPRRATAAEALDIDVGVVRLSALVELHGAFDTQQSMAAFDVRMLELGTTPEKASGIIGVDLRAPVGLARARGDRALVELGSSSPIDPAFVHALFTDMDAGRVAPGDAVERFRGLSEATGGAIARGVTDLEDAAGRTNADSLLDALESLRVADGFVTAAAPQGIDLSAVWFPSPGVTSQTAQATLTRLGAESADYAASSRRIRELGVPRVVTNLDQIETDGRVRAFDHAVSAALRGDLVGPGATDNGAVISDVFGGYIVRGTLLSGLVVTATAAVRDEAQRLAASERTAFLSWAGLAALLAVTSVAVAIAFSRSISRPLRGLADYAHAVNEGRLDADPSDGRDRGPRETRVAFAVFSDLVANLRLLDAKANALATCAFDDPVLRQPLPGRLASSLESSVATLSGSIVERDRLQTHLAHQVTHDALTGIANRAAAVVAIQEAIHRAGRSGEAMALLFVDLNDFKSVNDRHGHGAGDEVLRQVATRMAACVRAGDLVARLGGDEFVVVSERIGGVDGASRLAHRLVEAVTAPIDIGPSLVIVGAAIGIALTLDGPEEPLRLLARADAAMYRAKHNDRSAIEIFDGTLQRQMMEREDVEQALAEALAAPDGGGLLLHFQPVLATATEDIVGVEALVRWDRPGHGFLPPDAFIPIAEATSLIIDLDRWVLAEVGRHLVAWSDDHELADLPVAVNISGRHLRSGRLAHHLAALLQETGIDPRRLTIEITETVLLDDLVEAAASLDAVRRLGIRVAMDDFGTGYTSLAHLQHLPIDILKIDRSFVSQLDRPRGQSLVRMVTDLGHAIDLDIVAEGVETEAELSALRAIGADHLQGYLLSRPLPEPALKAWLHQRAPVG